jgi:hypothetical protein
VICKALIKHGAKNFTFSILEYCSKGKVVEREQFFLDTLRPEYNILEKAGNSAGFRHSAESKEKISLARQNYISKSRFNLAAIGSRYKPVKVKDLSSNSVKIFDSVRHTAKELKISRITVEKYIKNNIVYKNKKFSFN